MLNHRKLHLYRLVASVMPDGWRFQRLRTRLLRWCGAEVGEGVYFSARTRFEGGGHLIIDDGVWIGPYTLISTHDGSGMIPTLRIGKNCMIAHMCSIKTSTHEIDVDANASSVAGRNIAYDITIGEGSWICASVTIIPGVKVGRKCICAAGAVVIRDVPDYTMVAGVPAVAKKDLGREGLK